MPTIAEYKRHYPNLKDSEVKLLNAARIATQYNSWSTLSHVRTIGLKPLILDVPPPKEQLAVADTLLGLRQTKLYENDALHYPKFDGSANLVRGVQAPKVGEKGIECRGPEWVVCKKVGYHSDTTDCDKEAYAFWCIKSTAPMTLMLGGNAYPMKDGLLVIFDARVPHALLSGDKNATMIGIISNAELTVELREKLGISWLKSGARTSLDALRMMDGIEVDGATGSFGVGS